MDKIYHYIGFLIFWTSATYGLSIGFVWCGLWALTLKYWDWLNALISVIRLYYRKRKTYRDKR